MTIINVISPSVVHADVAVVSAGEENTVVVKTDGSVWITGYRHTYTFVQMWEGG